MIRISKSTSPPTPLSGISSPGSLALRKVLDAYAAGAREFDFSSSIFGHRLVKQQLVKDQNGKCFFCESKVGAIYHGDVEHFRPKAGVIRTKNGPLVKPGYYWLAYDWNNLAFSCALCNQTHKKNHFPLLDETQRACTHTDNISLETPLLVAPHLEDPRLFIEFHEEVARGIDSDGRGEATIRIVGLNRDLMLEKRREFAITMSLMLDLYSSLSSKGASLDVASRKAVKRAGKKLRDSVGPKNEFSAMAFDLLKRHPSGTELLSMT